MGYCIDWNFWRKKISWFGELLCQKATYQTTHKVKGWLFRLSKNSALGWTFLLKTCFCLTFARWNGVAWSNRGSGKNISISSKNLFLNNLLTSIFHLFLLFYVSFSFSESLLHFLGILYGPCPAKHYDQHWYPRSLRWSYVSGKIPIFPFKVEKI